MGIFDKKGKQFETRFEQEGLRADCELFREYFYTYEEMQVNVIAAPLKTYHTGDKPVLKGESFHYPEFFDLLVLKDQVAVRIRHGRIEKIEKLSQYEYSGLPVLNGRGLELLIHSQEDLEAFLIDSKEIDEISETIILNRWIKVDSYRHIRFKSSDQLIDYSI